MADGINLAKAYVQIIPSARGMKGMLTQSMGGDIAAAGDSAGSSLGKRLLKGLAAAGIGAAIGKFFTSTIKEGAALEQSIGGVETLFGKASATVIKNANNAWKTAGISANEYMQESTSFAASLLQSLHGNTSAAANYADMAIKDMSDNANKFGTNITDIQNAYQGFSKQNYTMLDNLRLGYGGTKTEMERLLSDAEKISGKKYDLSNLSDVYEAIHVVQKELGVTGTTSKEAATTLSGSLESMKAAAQNFLGQLVNGNGADIKTALGNLISSAETFLIGNLIPAIGRVISALGSLIAQAAPKIGPAISGLLSKIATAISNSDTGKFLAAAAKVAGQIILGLVQGLGKGIPKVLNAITGAIEKLSEGGGDKAIKAGIKWVGKLAIGLLKGIVRIDIAAGELVIALYTLLVELAGRFVGVGIKWVAKLASGIGKGVGRAISAVVRVCAAAVAGAIRYAGRFASAGFGLIVRLAAGILRGIGRAVSAMGRVISGILHSVAGVGARFASIGADIVRGIWSGISGATGWIYSKISGWVSNVVDWIKSKLGIGSPSKVMAKEVGRWIPEGMAKGITDNSDVVYDAMGVMGNGTIRSMLATPGMSGSRMATNSTSKTVSINMPVEVSQAQESPENYARRLASTMMREMRMV
jgi:phage-related protein